jgi:RND family efflux transporter MFP subunit
VYQRGGSAIALAEIDSGLRKAKLDLQAARREAASLERLVAANAATKQDLEQAQDRVRQLEAEMEGLVRKRESLLPEGGRAAAQARLQQAQQAAALARARIEQGSIKAPIAGVAYNVAVKAGAFLRPGDLVAELGRLERLRAILYVDEPELGRVGIGMPIAITWDAAPGRSWPGTVEKLPTRIVALETRQVGEVICRIDNRDGVLQPGANVNAEVRAAVAEAALTIPKEAIRRNGDRIGVLAHDGERIAWRDVRLGISSVTRVQITGGITEGEAVALPSSRALRHGDAVKAVFPP